jgi:hypothetical protein
MITTLRPQLQRLWLLARQRAVFGAIGVIVLYNIIGLLIAKELLLLSASGSEKAKRFGRVASVAIVWSRSGDVR